MAHTQNMNDSIAALPVLANTGGRRVTCPAGGFGYAGGDCATFSRPQLQNDLFWQNRTFKVDIVSVGQGLFSQQNLVVLSPALTQATSGACSIGAQFWDIGLRTDDVQSGRLSAAGNGLVITNSVLTVTDDIGTTAETVASATNKGGATTSPVIAQICNGARMPPEHCKDAGIDNNSPTCKGFNAPAGASESTSTPTLFVFSGIQPTATVDEGHNWLNLTYGPLTLAIPDEATSSAGEQMVAGPDYGAALGAYSLRTGSTAIGGGSANGAPGVDFYGNQRNDRVDIGAVQYTGATVAVVGVSPTTLTLNAVVNQASATQNVTLTNSGNANFAIPAVAFSANFSRNNGVPFPAGAPNCGGNLAAGASCTIKVQFTAPATIGTTNGTLTIAGVTGSPVALTGIAETATYKATISPATLAFGNWAAAATNTASSPKALTLTNTGNSALSGLVFTFGGGTTPFTRPTGAAGGTCGTGLAVGATCTVNVVFTPTVQGSFTRTLTVAGANGLTVAGSPASLTGTGVATRASVAASPLTITLPSGGLNVTGTGLVTFTNSAASASQVNVSNIGVGGGNVLTYFFTVGALAGPDNCTGVALAPGASCTVTVRFTNVTSPRGSNRTGTISFTSTGTPSPATAALTGFATP
jgi:hypothetical protein